MGYRMLGRLAAILVSLAVVPDARAWLFREHPSDGAAFGHGIAIAPDGNPVAAGWWYGPSSLGDDFRVRKHSTADGTVLWHFEAGGVPAGSNAAALEVRIDAAGDVIAAGYGYTLADVYDTIVVKLSGVDGTLVWRVDLDGVDYQNFGQLALAPDGDVVLLTVDGPFFASEPTVRRLDGATGAIDWTTQILGTEPGGNGFGLGVDAAGNALFGGEIKTLGGRQVTVAKLAGGTGTELWRSTLGSEGNVDTVTTDAAGDVVASGFLQVTAPVFTLVPVVAKFGSAAGSFLWQWDLPPVPNGDPATVRDHVLDGAGNVYATGHYADGLYVAKIDGATGGELWRRAFPGGDIPDGFAIALDPAGVPIVAGNVADRFTVLSVASDTGAPLWVEQLPGNRDNNGLAYDVAVDDIGHLFAVGTSLFPFVNDSDNPPRDYTVVRYPDPSFPPTAGSCQPAPRLDCRVPLAPAKSKLAAKDLPGTAKDRLKWSWTKGQATMLAELGDPTTAADDYSLCLYDGAGALIGTAAIPGGGTCGTKPCWRVSGTTGFVFHDVRPREPEGLDVLKLVSGVDGRAKVSASRKGRNGVDLPMPSLGAATLPLTVQVQHDGGICFGATFSSGGVLKNDGLSFKAISD